MYLRYINIYVIKHGHIGSLKKRLFTLKHTVKLKWLKHYLDHKNLFEHGQLEPLEDNQSNVSGGIHVIGIIKGYILLLLFFF